MAVELEVQVLPKNAITEGSQWIAIWRMSWPLLLNMIFVSLAAFADTWVSGKISSTAQAAVGLANQFFYFFILLELALSVGTTAVISRYWGAKDFKAAEDAARHSFVVAFVIGSISTIGAIIIGPVLFKTLGATQAVANIGSQFLMTYSLAILPTTLIWNSNAIFRAIGDSKTQLCIGAIVSTLIIIGDYSLCVRPFHFGIMSIAITWIVASLIGILLSWILLRRTPLSSSLDLTPVTIYSIRSWFKRLFIIGFPTTIQDLTWLVSNFVLLLVFAKTSNPTACQATWSIGLRVEETCVVMPALAFNLAAAAIVGQNLGAHQPERAVQSAQLLTAISAIVGLIFGIFFYYQAPAIAQFMSLDPAVIKCSTGCFKITAFAEVFFATWFVLYGAMQGAGYTMYPTIVSILSMFLVRIPLLYLFVLVLGMDADGCWLSSVFAQVTIAIAAVILFQRGAWKKQRV